MAYLIRRADNTMIGEVGIRSKYVPRIGETVAIGEQNYLVEDVAYRNEIVRYEREYRIDIYVSEQQWHLSLPPLIEIPRWDGIDEDRWIAIRKYYDELEAEEK